MAELTTDELRETVRERYAAAARGATDTASSTSPTDKRQVLREAARVLKPGGRFAVADIVADPDMDAATRADIAQYVGSIAGALTRDEFEHHLAAAGLTDIEITETHRVHEHAGSAIVRARKPAH